MKYRSIASHLLLSSALIGVSSDAIAQDNSSPVDEVVVVGTQIKGSSIAGILPVTSLSETDIELTGAVSGDELLAAIPQLGDVTFTEGAFTGVNGARGDVGSVNLRGVGDGNTLVLLNGRRLVNHPGTQAVNQTPVVSVNSNALPVTGIKRLEVLRDGASAVYGSDAVAGVINTQLDDDYVGLQTQIQYGTSEGTSLDELSGTVKWGKDFNEGRTNVSIFGNVMFRNGMPATDLRNSSTEDLRPFFEGTIYEGDTQLRNTSLDTPWGIFRTVSGGQATGIGDNDFHIQPDTFDGCRGPDLPGGVCADNSGSTSNLANLRLDRARYRDIVGDTDRYNIFSFVNHELDNGIELFGEASYYYADYFRERETAQIITSQRYGVSIPETAFYNPFGEAIAIGRLRPIDAGPRQIKVKNDSFRLLGGARGDWNDWDWETAFLHSEATTKDRTNRVSLTLFQEAIARTDSSAYNVFSGGSTADFSEPSGLNQQSTIDSFLVDVKRDSKTTLTLADAKLSNPEIFTLPAGGVGMAAGVEWRHESYTDDRDDRLDGTITFTDSVTGNTLPSDVMGTSPTPDTNGSRDVFGAFVELALPLVSEDMDIPLVHSFDVQLAARAENYSDVGSVLKPKIAASWFPIEQFQIRGAYAEGFRAPNLEQINATEIRRVNTGREDWILCEAIALDAGDRNFTSDDNCDSVGVEGARGGGPDLKPESNKNFSIGATFELSDYLTLTADWWRIEQTDIVGLFSDQNEISLDYALRLQGSSNPNVVRATPDADLADLFTSVGLDPSGAGEIVEVSQRFRNLNPRTSEGLDIGGQLDFDTDFGRFKISANAAQIREFFQSPSAEGQALIDAVNSGELNSLVDVVGQENLIKENGNPEWRYTGSLRWDKGAWGLGAFYKYVGDVRDTSVTGSDYDFLEIPAFRTLNLYGDYTFEDETYGIFDNVRLRFGVRNVGDKKPPIADEFARGYFVSLHSNRGRYWYGSVRKTF
ncbi:TonB-dependent receptor plug domain-containing protein [Litorimonas sp. RW-G-Af-16]|uniref:TonB-dependent receptor plug domain-containing protein n=1 Tax=Litorimonas sp. RW-G-Af-16 TaxID=3241168 RepID=UPI003AB0AD9F